MEELQILKQRGASPHLIVGWTKCVSPSKGNEATDFVYKYQKLDQISATPPIHQTLGVDGERQLHWFAAAVTSAADANELLI